MMNSPPKLRRADSPALRSVRSPAVDLLCAVLMLVGATAAASRSAVAAETMDERERTEFFEKKIRPVLVEHCYRCHSAEAPELRGGLRLDLKAGWQAGGESGQPAVVPGQPEESPLLRSVRHDADVSAMPPGESKLPAAVIADLAAWIQAGAADPRGGVALRQGLGEGAVAGAEVDGAGEVAHDGLQAHHDVPCGAAFQEVGPGEARGGPVQPPSQEVAVEDPGGRDGGRHGPRQ